MQLPDYFADPSVPDPEPGGGLSISLDGAARAAAGEEDSYAVSAANMNRLATVTLWPETDSAYLTGRNAESLNGFEVIGGVQWEDAGNGIQSGRLTLSNMAGGVSGAGPLEILSLTFRAGQIPGSSGVRIARVQASGYDGEDRAVFLESDITRDFAAPLRKCRRLRRRMPAMTSTGTAGWISLT